MLIVGIDPSMSNTVICSGPGLTPDPRDVQLCKFSEAPRGRYVANRIRRLETLVAKIADHIERLGPVDVLCIEHYAQHPATPGTALDLAEFGGILRFHLVDLATDIYEVIGSTLKKFCCGNGGPGKVGLAAGLIHRYGVNYGGDDGMYDAFGLYRMGLCLAGIEATANTKQHEAVCKVLEQRFPDPDECDRRVRQMFEQPVEKPW
jgi:hypothetical protein